MPLLWFLAAAIIIMATNKKTGSGALTLADRRAFVDQLGPIARRVEREGGTAPDGTKVMPGIKADLGIVQAGHESAWGRSGLAQAPAYNIFGMTAEPGYNWRTQGRPFVEMPTREFLGGKWVEVRRPFRQYSSWEASYLDWARRIQRPDFSAVFARAVAGDLPGFAAALHAAGYATDPGYQDKIVGVYNDARREGLVA